MFNKYPANVFTWLNVIRALGNMPLILRKYTCPSSISTTCSVAFHQVCPVSSWRCCMTSTALSVNSNSVAQSPSTNDRWHKCVSAVKHRLSISNAWDSNDFPFSRSCVSDLCCRSILPYTAHAKAEFGIWTCSPCTISCIRCTWLWFNPSCSDRDSKRFPVDLQTKIRIYIMKMI